MRAFKKSLLLTLAFLLLIAGSASAAIPDAPWRGKGTGTVMIWNGTTQDPMLDYQATEPTGKWELVATAKETRRQPIKYEYGGNHIASLEMFVSRNGQDVSTKTLAGIPLPPPGPFRHSDEATFDLQAGDVYGFRMSGSNGQGGTLTGRLRLISIRDVTPPTITPVVTGTLGKNGIYTSNVSVAWQATDSSSAVSMKSNCLTVNVTADTAGRTFTCTAKSDGGEASRSITIKRDATAPDLTVPGTVIKEGAGVVDYAATATDGVDPSPALACTPASGSEFALGATPVSCTATDTAGNTVKKSFDVLVLRAPDPAPAPAAAPEAAPAPQITQVHMGGPVTVTQAPKSINPVLAFRFTVTKRITQLKQLTVKNLPAGSTVSVSCKGSSCPKRLKGRTHAQRVAKTSIDISSLVKGPLKAGTVITVVVSSPEAVTATKKLTVRKNGAPQIG